MTLENTKELNLISYSIDFEQALIDTLKCILPDKRTVGCYYHYCRNIYKKAKNFGMLNNNENIDVGNILNFLYQLPFKYNDIEKIEIDKELSKLSNRGELFLEYINYFKTTWIPYFLNGMLNYVYLSKEQRSNSYLENYNRVIKEKLSNFLYGKNKCRISWPLLFYFIISEEIEYKNKIILIENSTERKTTKPEKFIDVVIINKEIHKEEGQYFLVWDNNSCRYDSFLFLYTYAIGPYLTSLKLTSKNLIFLQLEKIRNLLLKGNINIFKKGVWKILEDNKIPEMDLTSELNFYKRFNSVLQPINLLKEIDLFCFSYKVYEGCSLCKNPIESYQFLLPSIEINKNQLLKKESIETIIKFRLQNHQNACKECGYDKDGKIINNNTYFKIYSEIKAPIFIFVNFEFLNEDEDEFDDELEEEKKNFELRVPFNKNIYDYIIKNKLLFGNEYKLIGIICSPLYDHYNEMIIELLNNMRLWKVGLNYFNDGRIQNSKIIEVKNLEEYVMKNNPYIALYSKINQ